MRIIPVTVRARSLWGRFLLLCLSTAVVLVFSAGLAGRGPAQPPPGSAVDSAGYVGNEACAKCHAAIYQSYQATRMARASGIATDNLISGSFSHKRSGVNYRVYTENGKVWLSFERPGDPSVRGSRQLQYYIGQGDLGRTYLFSEDGFLFEAPVNWYGERHVWDMAPAYADAREAPMNLPALTSCLDCHVSGIQPPVQGTENRYKLPPFLYSGVTCERCHGPGAEHVNGGGIINPVKLGADRRDAVCMQCHLEGDVAIERAGKHLYQFRPGDDLPEYVQYYIRVAEHKTGLGATSQFEALWQSTCKKRSGERMSCTSCHDPHRQVLPEQRIAFYREKCLACHGTVFGQKHHVNQPDCTKCHMPANASVNIAHTEVTDHRIPRRPSVGPPLVSPQAQSSQSQVPRLTPFPDLPEAQHDERDMALAWASLAEGNDPDVMKQAEQLLRKAVIASSKDPALLTALGYLVQKRGATKEARELYERALQQDPALLDAATNLGVLDARSGDVQEAVKLWQGAFQRAPGRSSIGINLARVFCAAGQLDDARKFTMRVLQFNPDLAEGKRLLNELNGSSPKCSP